MVYRRSHIDAAIKDAIAGESAFSGGCAAFAVALSRVLRGGTILAFDGDHYEYVDHVVLRYRGRLYDGRGLVSRAVLEAEWGRRTLELSPQDALRLVDPTGGGLSCAPDADAFEGALRAAYARQAKRSDGEDAHGGTRR